MSDSAPLLTCASTPWGKGTGELIGGDSLDIVLTSLREHTPDIHVDHITADGDGPHRWR
jgi:hypothetical protein